tara:strand:+ start:5962 stop:7314 length:1353 start_codon:yes stop_codon:yes gene_type:complete
MSKPLVALVGRPNVGKSTLFNRLAEQRLAVVDDTPGTTRDRIMAEIEWNGMLFDLVDTGGIETYQETTNNPTSSSNFIKEIKSQYETAISEADTIVLMTDVTTGITSSDIYVANLLIQNKNAFKDKKILLAVNKCDNQNRTMNANEFYQLGITNLHPIAALHGLGIGDLLDDITMHLPQKKANNSNATTSIAIVGRPNVGKSSLLNRLLGQDRVIVSSVSGTTRDAIDTKLTYHKSTITLIDTAGIRRRGKITPGVEKYSVIRTLKAIDRAEIVLLIIDASEPFTSQDAHIAGMTLNRLRSVIVIVNKWDKITKDTYTMQAYTNLIRSKLQFLEYVPILFLSALTGEKVNQVLPLSLQVQTDRQLRISTSQLNRLISSAVRQHAPPSKNGKRLRIFYATQVTTAPPTILLHINDKTLVHFSYTRYIENKIREQFAFSGTPIRITYRERNE